MRKLIPGMFLSFLASASFAAGLKAPAILPQPQKLELQTGAFKLTPETQIFASQGSLPTARQLAATLRRSSGYPLKTSMKSAAGEATANIILLTTKNARTNLGPEGYELTVASNSVVIRAPTSAGLFYGVQTLLQLLPPEIFSSNVMRQMDWQMPCVHIEDWPRFKWRGLMLDDSDHWFGREDVEHLLDAMAMHKLNMFHWHLVDDEGWRIEIRKYPKLTQAGAWRSGIGWDLNPKSSTAYGPDGRYGGYYTQADIREIVAYAAAQHITIVPEIEMPGHSGAVLQLFPELKCVTSNGIPARQTASFCPGNDASFTFLQNVLAEVFELFPGPYLHIGGDEVNKENWKTCPQCQLRMKSEGLKNEEELQSYFIKRMDKFIDAHGKTLVGWSEILQGGLAQNAVVMDWIGGGKEAAAAGHNVVMSPTSYCYFDYCQSSNHLAEPKAFGDSTITLSQVYSFDPVPTGLAPQFQSRVLGVQGNLWTELIPNLKHAEYMAFPRACALAEVAWSSESSRDWDAFCWRLKIHERRLEILGVNYRRSLPLEQPPQ